MRQQIECALSGARSRSATLVLLSSFALLPLTAGSPSAATINVPGDQPTVRAAVDAAANGDVILIAPGTHEGGVFIDGKAVTLASWFFTTGDTSYIAQTVLDGVAAGVCVGHSGCTGESVIELGTNAHGTALVGLTITNGTNGVASHSIVDISYCRIIANGDGLDFNAGSGGTWSHSLFANNRDDGIDLNGRVDGRIRDNIVRDNHDDGIEFRLYAYNGALQTTEITGNRFTGNGEDGIQLIDYTGISHRAFRIERNLFSRNVKAAVACMPDQNTVEDLSGAPIAESILLVNNTFATEAYGFVGGAEVTSLNNLFVGISGSALRRVAGNSIASYNMFWATGTDAEASNVDPAHTWHADPKLGPDWKLSAGSPAIDAGTALFEWQGVQRLNLPASSYSGTAPDLGAFESALSQPVPLSITCPGPATIRCPATPSFPAPTVLGNCANPSVTFADETAPGTCPQRMVVTRTWTVTDACGGRASCSQAITVIDDTAPILSAVGGPGTIECPARPSFDEPVASDACDPGPQVSFEDVTTPGKCPQEYSVTRTWTATDACGNSSTASRTITVKDKTAPVIHGAGGPMILECPAAPQFSEPTATDECDPSPSLTFADVTAPGSCPRSYSVTRTWTATDACGNTGHANQTITVADHAAPQISGVAGNQTLECPASPVFDTPTATDACDPSPTLTFADVTIPGTCPQSYSVTRTWTAIDACGNTGTASQTLRVEDHTPPEISGVGPPETVACSASPAFSEPHAVDGCDPSPVLTFADLVAPGTCPQLRAVTRTWTATDGCGNSRTASQTLTIEDHTAPEITGVDGPRSVACGSAPTFSEPRATDLCDPSPVLTFTDVTTPGSCPRSYSVTRTWTAADACGNTSGASQTVTVVDDAPPVFTNVGGPLTIECPATAEFGEPGVSDGCDPSPSVTFRDETLPGACPRAYSITRTWTAIDACGNRSEASRTITLEDRTAPVFSGLGGAGTFECPAMPRFDEPIVSDGCDPSPQVAFTDVTTPGSCPQQYSVTRTWTATDDCGNHSSASQTLTIEDRVAPVVVERPADATIGCPASPQFGVPRFADNCDTSPSVSFADRSLPPTCPAVSVIERTWTATDACGNRATCRQTITLEDHAAPEIGPAGAPRSIECPATPAFDPPAASDACDPSPTLTFADVTAPGACPQQYSVTRTWTATDACGNSSQTSQTLTVEDHGAPEISGVGGPQTVECPGSLAFGDPVARDACDPSPSLTFTDVTTPGACPQSYSVTRTWTATDACGNSSGASRTLAVEDHTPPMISDLGQAVTVECPTAPQFGDPRVSDTCDPSPVVTFVDASTPGACPEQSSVTRTWTATDACGNSSQASLTITVGPSLANQAPVAALTVTPATGNEPLDVVADAAGSSDSDGSVASYQFDFGDGTVVGPQAEARAEHRYAAGRWTAKVTVVDDDGATHSVGVAIRVAEVPAEPNLVGNPSFESDSLGWRVYPDARMERVPGGFDGDHALEITGTAGTPGRFGINDSPSWVLQVPSAGSLYRLTAWVRSNESRGHARLQVREYLHDLRVGMAYAEPVQLSPEWEKLTLDYATTSQGSWLDLLVLDYPQKPGEVFLVDNLSIRALPGTVAGGLDPEMSLAAASDSLPFRVGLHPSPLRSRGTLNFTTSQAGPLRVEILDLAGRRVRQLADEPDAPAGNHRVAIDVRGDNGAPLSAGMYFYRIDAREGATTGRFLIIR